MKISHDCQKHGGVEYECEVVVMKKPPVCYLLVKILSQYHAKKFKVM